MVNHEQPSLNLSSFAKKVPVKASRWKRRFTRWSSGSISSTRPSVKPVSNVFRSALLSVQNMSRKWPTPGELFKHIQRKPGVEYTALWLNEKGFRKALTAKDVHIDPRLILYASDTLSRQNNNCSADEMRERQRDWIRLYQEHGHPLDSAYVLAAFGCNFEGEIAPGHVLDIFRWVVNITEELAVPTPNLIIADSMGWGNPETVRRMIDGVRSIAPDARIGMHIHDTRGLGIAQRLRRLVDGG